MKQKRLINKELVKSYDNTACEICGVECGTRAHHVKTVGSRGDDHVDNLLPLCVLHHNMIHKKGTSTMAKKFPIIREWLINHRWEYVEMYDKWFSPDFYT